MALSENEGCGVAVLGFVIGVSLASALVGHVGNSIWKQWLVDEGVAEWRVDNHGKSSWHWLKAEWETEKGSV